MSESRTESQSADSFAAKEKPLAAASTEFPYDLLSLLRCNRDAGTLILASELRTGRLGVIQALMRCTACGTEYVIENGIAFMMTEPLTVEEEREIAIRNSQLCFPQLGPFVPPFFGWRSRLSDLLEIPQHLEELTPQHRKVLEIGCGDGRFTMLMARMGARVLAVDFSINALRTLAARLPSAIAPTAWQPPPLTGAVDLRGRVGLVHADASRLRLASRSFDRALCTTPLDSREERMALYRTIAEALTDAGRYVGSVENDDLTRRLLGLPVARRYSSGIFIEHFRAAQFRCEAAPYFSKICIRPIRPRLPFLHRLPQNWALALSRIVAVLPGFRQLGEILILRADRPARQPREGVHRPGNKLVKRLYRWHMQRIGKRPLWEENEPV